jgi:hypothetical protein
LLFSLVAGDVELTAVVLERVEARRAGVSLLEGSGFAFDDGGEPKESFAEGCGEEAFLGTRNHAPFLDDAMCAAAQEQVPCRVLMIGDFLYLRTLFVGRPARASKASFSNDSAYLEWLSRVMLRSRNTRAL